MRFIIDTFRFISAIYIQKLGSFIGLVRPLTLVFWSFVGFFLLCNFGEQVSKQLDTITDAISECEWYSFPIEVQKMSLTVMTATQKPLIFSGFSNIRLTRDTFKKVKYLLLTFIIMHKG